MAIQYITDSSGMDSAISFLSEMPIIGVDSETTGFDPLRNKVLLIQMGNKYQQFVFDVARLENEVKRLAPILESKKILKVLHNGKFDYKFLKAVLGIEIENMFDTMIAEQLLQKGRKLSGFSLADVSEKYASIKLDKSVRSSFADVLYGETFTQEQIEYAAADVKFLEDIMVAQERYAVRDGLLRTLKLEMRAIQVTGDMELNGMRIDRAKWLLAEADAKVEKQKALDSLDALFAEHLDTDMFGKPNINYNSPKQLLSALNKAIPGANLTSTKEEYLEEIGHPITEALIYYRGMEKRISTYGESFLENINPATGRIHTTFNQLKTNTARYASEDPNLQNIPAKETKIYRDAFVAFDDDSVLVDADYSNMELRILADLSREPAWLEIFESGKDMHCEIGSMLFNKEIRLKKTLGPDDPGLNTDLRNIAKQINFGVGYGMGPKKLAKKVKVSFAEAKQLLNKYWTSFPKVKKFFDDYVAEALEAKCVRSPYDNRMLMLGDIDLDSPKEKSSVRNMIMNYPMQSGNASITKVALADLRDALKASGSKAKIICTIHDEILLNSPKSEAEEVEQLLVRTMINAANQYVKHVKIQVSSAIAPYWSK